MNVQYKKFGKIFGIILVMVMVFLAVILFTYPLWKFDEREINKSVNGQMSTNNFQYFERMTCNIKIVVREGNYALLTPKPLLISFETNITQEFSFNILLPIKESGRDLYYFSLFSVNTTIQSYNWIDCLAIMICEVEG